MSADRIREAYDYWSGQLRYQQARATQPRFVLDRCRRAGAMGGQTMRRKEKFTAPLGIGGACMMCRQIDADLIPVDAVTVRADVLLVLLAYCDRRGWSERLLTVAVCKYGVNLHRDFSGQPGATEAR